MTPSLSFEPGQTVSFSYTNWRGETALRTVEICGMRFGATDWHPQPQWLLLARDLEKNADREFALADIDPTTLTAQPRP